MFDTFLHDRLRSSVFLSYVYLQPLNIPFSAPSALIHDLRYDIHYVSVIYMYPAEDMWSRFDL